MYISAKAAKQAAALVVLALVLSLGSAYMGAALFSKHQLSQSHVKNYLYKIDEPPRPCPDC